MNYNIKVNINSALYIRLKLHHLRLQIWLLMILIGANYLEEYFRYIKSFWYLESQYLTQKLKHYGVKGTKLKQQSHKFPFLVRFCSSFVRMIFTKYINISIESPLQMIQIWLVPFALTLGNKTPQNEYYPFPKYNESKEIQRRLELDKLSLNAKKTKYMIFHKHQRDIINHIPKLWLNGVLLVRVEDCNFRSDHWSTYELECTL